jgi:hypothetical protein
MLANHSQTCRLEPRDYLKVGEVRWLAIVHVSWVDGQGLLELGFGLAK